ncbi:MAG: DUF2163 domain-containing protein [Hyphomicrobiaceae bacterium]|nr:DUF2163 domain-containing protein [Hyphomicrobiaceae bacterium]
MKTLHPDLETHVKSGATTLCWCWRLTRRDGLSYGFTDHDRDIEFDGTIFEAAAGIEAGEISESVGLSVDNMEISGAVTSERLSETDLASGLYDDAAVEIFRVNWQAPQQHVLMRSGTLGEVRQAGKAFAVEIRGLSHYLQQPKGRLYQFGCDTDLGSTRCGIDLSSSLYRATGVVAEVVSRHRYRVSADGGYEDGWFSRGLVRVTSGAAKGFESEIRNHTATDEGAFITLWEAPVTEIVAGDAVVIEAGCDKQFSTCRERFANAKNFRGFPHMPGNDFVTGYVQRSKS